MRRYGPVLLLAAILICFGAWTTRAQSHGEGSYQLVSNNMGPNIYRLNKETGDVCAIMTYEMKFAYRSLIKLCPDITYLPPPKSERRN